VTGWSEDYKRGLRDFDLADPSMAVERAYRNLAGYGAQVRWRLRALRSEQGLTLQQVAERANIDVSTLSRLGSGKH
jgi:predicted transcriptional regulator